MGKAGFEPRSADLEADALPTRPMRQSRARERLGSLVVKRPPRGAGHSRIDPRFLRLSHSSDLKLSTEVTDLPDNRLVGLVVKASASRAEDPGFESRLRRDFSEVESYQ